VIAVVMFVLAGVNLVLVAQGQGSWLLVGGALVVAVGALGQLVLVAPGGTRGGERVATTTRSRAAVVGLTVVAAVFLVIAGVRDHSGLTWFIAGLFLTGLLLSVVGLLRHDRRPEPPVAPIDGQQPRVIGPRRVRRGRSPARRGGPGP
jgi:hypothetical protein